MATKTELSREELANVFLGRLRLEAGMANISDVSISEINDPDIDGNWRAVVLERDREDIAIVLHAVQRTLDALRPYYILATNR